MIELSFLYEKKILARSKQKATFALMCVGMEIDWLFQFTFSVKFREC